MEKVESLRYLMSLCLLVVIGVVSANAKADEHSTDTENRHATVSIGIGGAIASVVPNTDDTYYEGSGLSLGFGLGGERSLTDSISLTARLDVFNSLSLSSLTSSANASWAFMGTAGVIVGNPQRKGHVYLSATVGAGVAILSDQGLDEDGNSICILCTGKEGGSSAGLAGRLAIGLTNNTGARFELVFMRAGGNGNDNDYTNGEDAFLQTIMVQISSGVS